MNDDSRRNLLKYKLTRKIADIIKEVVDEIILDLDEDIAMFDSHKTEKSGE